LTRHPTTQVKELNLARSPISATSKFTGTLPQPGLAQEKNNVHVFSGGRLIYQAHACRVMVMLVQQQCLVTGRQSMALI
jgi:hypothetical protein